MTRGTPPYRGLYRLPIAYAPTVLSNHTNDRASGLWRYFQIPFRPRYDTCACRKLTQNTNSGEAPILFQGLPNPSISYPGTTSTDFSRAFCVCFSRSLSQISLSLSCPSLSDTSIPIIRRALLVRCRAHLYIAHSFLVREFD